MMALDKQKILNELGNVVNQLQSADCGCMGKLFSNSNQSNQNGYQNTPMMSPAHDGCCCHGHSCGHGCHSFNTPGAGEPFSGNRHCMGHCNPPKLFADTYNYLNRNLMQPVVKEVYEDLKSITPANTITNSPMGAQMGLSQGNNLSPASGVVGGEMGNFTQNQMPGGAMGNFAQNQMPGGAMGNFAQNQMPGGAMGNQNAMSNHGPNVRFGNPNLDNQNNSQNNQQQMGQMAQPMAPMGMGPKILNMMMGEKSGGSQNQGGPQGGANANNAMQPPAMGMTSNMHGDVSQGQYNADMTGNHPGQYNMGMNNMVQESPGVPMQNPTAQYMSQPNMYTGANANMQGNSYNANMGQMNPGAQQMQGNANPIQPQMNAHNPYGQHSAGMAKFNEMFPGVMQGGDLGFDPMAIAIQMNPANQQRAAMDTMQKMMMKNTEALNRANASLLQPVINATNTAMSNLVQPSQPTNQQAMVPTSMQQQIPGADPTAVPVQNNQVPQQQVYTAMTGSPTMNQRQILQQVAPQYQQPRQQMVDPNTGAVINGALPTVYEGSVDPNARQEGSPPQATQQMIKEPIFPADTSRSAPPDPIKAQKYYQYNTLGQPIEMLPVDGYRTVIPDLPQTLSPQVIPTSDSARYSNVKATVSKTALMGNRPVGRTPSRSQLQQIYNQYKGSQSYTQQNIRPPDNNGASYSEGNLNVTQANAIRQAPVERVGGDTVANNASNNAAYKMEIKPGQVGDVPVANKPPAEPEKAPVNNSRVRNGLQDMKYTSYATSAAWSFHGATPAPSTVPAMYRFRNRA
nr:uncharacterized protein LOC110373188 [Helicoverpa armigera]